MIISNLGRQEQTSSFLQQRWLLHLLQKLVDGVDVGMYLLTALNLGPDDSGIGQPTLMRQVLRVAACMPYVLFKLLLLLTY